jgi:GcrA cell cycle regulator
MMATERRWHPDEIETLTKNWLLKSASQIGAILDRSRNSICGMAHRLRIQGRLPDAPNKLFLVKPSTAHHHKRERKPKPLKVLVMNVDYIPPPPPEPAPDRPPSLVELLDHQCKWPLGDPRADDFGFCARARVAGMPYCRTHCGIAYNPQGRHS